MPIPVRNCPSGRLGDRSGAVNDRVMPADASAGMEKTASSNLGSCACPSRTSVIGAGRALAAPARPLFDVRRGAGRAVNVRHSRASGVELFKGDHRLARASWDCGLPSRNPRNCRRHPLQPCKEVWSGMKWKTQALAPNLPSSLCWCSLV